jgi:hypothetical protein
MSLWVRALKFILVSSKKGWSESPAVDALKQLKCAKVRWRARNLYFSNAYNTFACVQNIDVPKTRLSHSAWHTLLAGRELPHIVPVPTLSTT